MRWDWLWSVPATWYLQWVVVDADVIAEPREWAVEKLEARYHQFPSRKALQLIGCGLCVSFWAAVALDRVPGVLVRGLGRAGAVMAMKRLAEQWEFDL